MNLVFVTLKYPQFTYQFFLMCILVFHQSIVIAESSFQPRLMVSEEFIDNERNSLSESGNITTISPGFLYKTASANSDLFVDYSLDTVTYSGLASNDKTNQRLSLLANIAHKPKRWNSQIFSNIQQTNISSDGVQILDPTLQSDNFQELRTFGVNTTVNGRIMKDVRYKTRLNIDHAEYENSENSQGAGALFSIDNFAGNHKFSWKTEFSSQLSKNSDNEERIETALLNLNYQLNTSFSSFLNMTSTSTRNGELDEAAKLIGLLWKPDKNSMLKIGAGVRGEDESYTLDARLRKRKIELNASYKEQVTSARSSTLEEFSTGGGNSSGTVSSIDINPVLEKRSSIGVTAQGRLTTLLLSLFQIEKDQGAGIVTEEVKGYLLNLSRQISRRSTLAFNYLHQETKVLQDNKLSKVKVSYDHVISKNMTLGLSLRQTQQKSTLAENEYKLKVVGMLFTATF